MKSSTAYTIAWIVFLGLEWYGCALGAGLLVGVCWLETVLKMGQK